MNFQDSGAGSRRDTHIWYLSATQSFAPCSSATEVSGVVVWGLTVGAAAGGPVFNEIRRKGDQVEYSGLIEGICVESSCCSTRERPAGERQTVLLTVPSHRRVVGVDVH